MSAPSVGLRRLWAIDEKPGFVALAQKPVGKVLLAVLFTLLLVPEHPRWWAAGAFATLIGFSGTRRFWALLATTVANLYLQAFWFNPYPVEVAARGVELPGNFNIRVWMAIGLAAALVFYGLALCFGLLRKRPVTVLLSLMAVLLLTLEFMPRGVPHVLLWAFTCPLGGYLWFVVFAAIDKRKADGKNVALHLGTLHAFWNPKSAVPVGKGLASLEKVAAKTPEELAVTQLKAIKLLLWAWVLRGGLEVYQRLVFDKLGVPTLADAFAADKAGHSVSLLFGVASVVAYTFDNMLQLAIVGHRVVALARMAGFRLLRNTWRPLESRSLADYWNRYYYFFKEVMADLFFYPAFFRYFKTRPKLRLFFATCAAAGFGNLVFHWVMDIEAVAVMGLWQAVVTYQSMAFYMVLLAAGIGVSQLRAQRKAARFLPALGVWSYVCLLQVFSYEDRAISLPARFQFLFHLLSP